VTDFSVGERPIPEPDEASRPFFDATLRGELLLQHCGACGRWMWPAKVRCIECLATLYSYTLVHQLVHPGFKDEMPYNLALVDLEEGVRTHSSIVGVAADELRVGMPLSVVFVPASEHIAIPMFEPG
jgi:uncharacterized OB-fold protein